MILTGSSQMVLTCNNSKCIAKSGVSWRKRQRAQSIPSYMVHCERQTPWVRRIQSTKNLPWMSHYSVRGLSCLAHIQFRRIPWWAGRVYGTEIGGLRLSPGEEKALKEASRVIKLRFMMQHRNQWIQIPEQLQV
jgi:hypothetical protein